MQQGQESDMHTYAPTRPSALVGVAAAALSTLVLALAVLVPAKLAHDERARIAAASAPHIEVAIVPSRIDVVGVRTQRTAANAVEPAPVRLPNS
jgi:hypothetical protein